MFIPKIRGLPVDKLSASTFCPVIDVFDNQWKRKHGYSPLVLCESLRGWSSTVPILSGFFIAFKAWEYLSKLEVTAKFLIFFVLSWTLIIGFVLLAGYLAHLYWYVQSFTVAVNKLDRLVHCHGNEGVFGIVSFDGKTLQQIELTIKTFLELDAKMVVIAERSALSAGLLHGGSAPFRKERFKALAEVAEDLGFDIGEYTPFFDKALKQLVVESSPISARPTAGKPA